MNNQLKSSVILLFFLGVLFSAPIVAMGYSLHGAELAMLGALSGIVLVMMGTLAFFLLAL